MAMDSLVDSLFALIWLVLKYLFSALITTFSQIFILLGPGLILAFLMHQAASMTEKGAYRLFGRKLYLILFGWLGTTIHETGHALFCIIFRHRINEIKFFDPDPASGSLGYVNHSYNPDSMYQEVGNFFIGIGPIILGTLFIYYSSRYLLGQHLFNSLTPIPIESSTFTSWNSFVYFAKSVYNSTAGILSQIFIKENLSNWKFYLFLYITFSVGSSITLSKPDIEGAMQGFFYSLGLLFFFNMATLWIGNFATGYIIVFSKVYSVFYTVMLFAILMNLIVAIVILLLPASLGTARASLRKLRG